MPPKKIIITDDEPKIDYIEKLIQQITFKDNSVEICLNNFSKQEHYEVVRIILAYRSSNTHSVKVCKHNCLNKWTSPLFDELGVEFISCLPLLSGLSIGQ